MLAVVAFAGCIAVGSHLVRSGGDSRAVDELAFATAKTPSAVTGPSHGADPRDSSSVEREPSPPTASGVSTPPEPLPPSGPSGLCSSVTLSVPERARLLLFLTIEPNEDRLRTVIATGVGGLFVPASAVALVADGTLRAALADLDRRPLVAIDEEGGRVQRLGSIIGPLPSAREMSALGPEAIRELARQHGAKMRDLGVTVDFAPVLDVVDDVRVTPSDAIGDRSFSADPSVVAAAAGAFAAGLADAGVLPTYKHFPGHGHASGDSHHGLVTTPPVHRMGPDLDPFEQLLARSRPEAAVMVGHLLVPELTNGEPASVSHAAITGLLRERLGFDGLVVTDDLGTMRGILARHTTVDAAVLAVAAGADMVLVPASASESTSNALVDAVGAGRIPADQLTASADRVLRAQQPGTCDQP